VIYLFWRTPWLVWYIVLLLVFVKFYSNESFIYLYRPNYLLFLYWYLPISQNFPPKPDAHLHLLVPTHMPPFRHVNLHVALQLGEWLQCPVSRQVRISAVVGTSPCLQVYRTRSPDRKLWPWMITFGLPPGLVQLIPVQYNTMFWT